MGVIVSLHVDYFREHPLRVFYLFVFLHVICWTLLPALVNPNLPQDVIEGLAWGREWQLGYHKHPPIKPWLLEATAIIFNRNDWAFYFLSQLCVVVAFWAVWRLANDFLTPKWALLSVLLLEGIYYHNYSSPEFNVNVAQLPFWALTGLCTWRALNSSSLVYGILTGLFIALGFLSKYIFGFLAITILFMLICLPPFRKAFKTPTPYLAISTGLLIVLPHLLWVFDHDFTTLTYGLNRAVGKKAAVYHLFYPARFAITQSLILIPSLIMIWVLRKKTTDQNVPKRDLLKAYYLIFMTFGPPVFMIILSGIFGWKLRSMWGTPLFLFSGLTLVYFLQPFLSLNRWRRFVRIWTIIFILPLVAYWGEARFVPIFTGQGNRVHFPGKKLAQTATKQWYQYFKDPPRTVIGSFWHAGNLSYHAAYRPSVFIDADPMKSPWIKKKDVAEKGAIVLGKNKNEAYALAREATCKAIDMGEINLPCQYAGNVPPVSLWMIFCRPYLNEGGIKRNGHRRSLH